MLYSNMWDQIRVDHGREFYLMLFIQENLRFAGRGDSQIAPYVQTTSTNNHIIERIWVELNQRVAYPVKRVVSSMDNDGHINMDDPITKFSISSVLLRVCEVGMKRFISAWNSHSVPNRGIPIIYKISIIIQPLFTHKKCQMCHLLLECTPIKEVPLQILQYLELTL